MYTYRSVFMYSTGYSGQIVIKREFSGQIIGEKNIQISNVIKIRPAAAELFCTYREIVGRTDRQ
jgi:hypothetical protein